MGLLQGLGKSNPMQILNNLVKNDPQLTQRLNMIQTMTNGDTNNAKELVIKQFQSGNITKNQFQDISRVAKKMGIDDSVISELEQYIK
jgi:hypothetical protein